MNPAEHYVYRVHWSPDDDAYVGTVAEFPSLSWISDTRIEAFSGIQDLAIDVVTDLIAEGEQVPEAISDRSYSGKFQLRIPPELHRRLAVAACEQNVSLNRLASSRLAGH